MNKEIKYNGLTAMPSEYDSPDGDLGAMINLVPEDNGLKPTGNFKPVFTIENGSNVSYIHTTGKYKHYICIEKSENIYGERPWGKGTLIYWLDNMVNGKTMEEIYEEDGEPASFDDFVSADIAGWAADQAHTEPHPNQIYVFPQGTEIYAIKGIGNVLLMMTSDGMHYSLWSDEDERYNYLGDHIPELPINFGLVGHFTHMPADKSKQQGKTVPYGTVADVGSDARVILWEDVRKRQRIQNDDARRQYTSGILSKVNKFIQEASVNQGRFLFPFLVRYGLRLYDGELTMLSSPVLMEPGDDPVQCIINSLWVGSSALGAYFTIVGMTHDLDFQVMNAADLEKMLKWKDIVKSVDIYISKPFYTYDQNGEIEYLYEVEYTDDDNSEYPEIESTGYYYQGKYLSHPEEELPRYASGTFNYASNSLREAFEGALAPITRDNTNREEHDHHELGFKNQSNYFAKCSLPKRSIVGDISDCADFYLLKSIPLEELTTNRTQIVVKKDFLQSLVNRERLKNDYDSHDKLIPKYVFDYNARLNITDIKKQLYDKFSMKAALPFAGQYVGDYTYTDPEEGTLTNTGQASAPIIAGQGDMPTDFDNVYLSEYLLKTQLGIDQVDRLQEIIDEQLETFVTETINRREASGTRATDTQEMSCFVTMKQEYKEFAIRLADFAMVKNFPIHYLYYPNPNAKEIILGTAIEEPVETTWEAPTSEGVETSEDIAMSGGYHNPNSIVTGVNGKSYKLERHDFLTGAFYSVRKTGTLNTANRDFYFENYTFEQKYVMDLENKIYTSEANNPFLFPVTGINTIGTGHIIGMASATKALSQGQFGQFPLYAFTTEGVWSLEVSSTGSYSSKHPLSRDVCTNAAGITQTDDAVLFPTDRGIMLLQGSNTIPISDVLNSRYPFDEGVKGDIEKLPKITEILQSEGISAETLNHERWLEYLKGCQIAYDYTNQRIIVYNTSKDYAYIYCLQTKMWGMIACKVRQPQPINSYPDALLQVLTERKGYRIDNFSKETLKPSKVFYITRTLKLDAADVLKTVDTVIQRGMFRRGAVKSVLYGSRDLHHWHLVASSTTHEMRRFSGTPYKYFRILVMGELQADENISGCTINYTPKHTNKIR